MAQTSDWSGTLTTPGAVRVAVVVLGIAFLVIGVLGFIPGVTTHHEELQFAGQHSKAQLLGLFTVSVLHNLVHVASGVAGLAAAWSTGAARMYLLVGGSAYFAVWAYGLLIHEHSEANFLPVNTADNWLHLGLASGMVLLGMVLGPSRP